MNYIISKLKQFFLNEVLGNALKYVKHRYEKDLNLKKYLYVTKNFKFYYYQK